jgi:hypothetical protein
MKKIIIITIAIMLLSACEPSQKSIENAISQTQAAITALTFTPIQEVQTPTRPPSFAEILGGNGFHQTRNYCTSICTSYELYQPQMIAKVYDNGMFSIEDVAPKGGVLDVQILYLVLTQAYGQDLTDWATEHLNASFRKEQTGSVGNFDITMSGKANERVIITIIPKK